MSVPAGSTAVWGDPITAGLALVTGGVSLVVGYVAYRAYRRNESLPMLFVAAGFLLAFWAPVMLGAGLSLLELAVDFSPSMTTRLPWAVETAGRVSELVGLLLLLYGLAMPLRR